MNPNTTSIAEPHDVLPDDLPQADLSENARIVLARRYLKKDERGRPVEEPETMFWRVARVIAQDICVQPSFMPGVGPSPAGTGRWTREPATAAERTAAASLYLALMTQACLDLCGLGREIIIEGPLARNALFGQALARLTGVPVSASGDATGTSLGASMLFGAGEGHATGGTVREPLDVPGFDAYAQNWRDATA